MTSSPKAHLETIAMTHSTGRRWFMLAALSTVTLASAADAQFKNPIKSPKFDNPLKPIIDQGGKAINNAGNAAAELDRQRLEAQRRAEEQLRRVRELENQVRQTVARFEDMRRQVERRQNELKELQRLSQSSNQELYRRGVSELIKAGALGTNRDLFQRNLQNGLSLVIFGKEFDHPEQVMFAKAIAASVATANPGPAMLYLQQFLARTKQEVMKNLRNAPRQVQTMVERELEMLMIQSLDAILNGRRRQMPEFQGVRLQVGLATYNHWVNVRYREPRLVENGTTLGVRLYRIDMIDRDQRIPLPNTFQPYVRVEVQFAGP